MLIPFPRLTSPSGFQTVNHPYVMVCCLKLKLSRGYKDLFVQNIMHQEKESSIIYNIYYKLAANLALEGFYPGKYPVQLSLKQRP